MKLVVSGAISEKKPMLWIRHVQASSFDWREYFAIMIGATPRECGRSITTHQLEIKNGPALGVKAYRRRYDVSIRGDKIQNAGVLDGVRSDCGFTAVQIRP